MTNQTSLSQRIWDMVSQTMHTLGRRLYIIDKKHYGDEKLPICTEIDEVCSSLPPATQTRCWLRHPELGCCPYRYDVPHFHDIKRQGPGSQK